MEIERRMVYGVRWNGTDYERNAHGGWTQRYGDSWEYVNDDQELEAEFQMVMERETIRRL